MFAFRRIGHRILLAAGMIVVFGIAAVIVLYAQRQEETILAQNERALTNVTDSGVQGLQAIMLRGYAEIAHDYAERLKRVGDVIDYRILRLDGREAFIDNETIQSVNAHLGNNSFDLRADPPPAPRVLDPRDRYLAVMMVRKDHVIYYETGADGERQVTVLEPIRNHPDCRRCHVADEPLRGLIKLTTSLKAVDADIAATWRLSALVILLAAGGIFAVVWWAAQRVLVRPIRTVTKAMSNAARGDLATPVPVTGPDEIGMMARSFNRMSADLLELYTGLSEEQDKLMTIVLGAREGIVVTDSARNIVLVNPAAAMLLGKSEMQIVSGGFINLVDDPDWMQERLKGAEAEALIEYQGRMLMMMVATTADPVGGITGSTAIIRDVTEERRLAAELQRSSITDALTGLFNRRHFDQQLAEEYRRWRRYRGAFSVAMLDVDHFKRFNDTHGHDCGDRVLQSIGALLLKLDDKSIVPCRYGGEELVLILPDISQQAAMTLAEGIRRQIEALVIDGLHVTVSIGVAGCPQQLCENGEVLLKFADAALYKAKEEGRNRVVGA